jgi:hypothetical protein
MTLPVTIAYVTRGLEFPRWQRQRNARLSGGTSARRRAAAPGRKPRRVRTSATASSIVRAMSGPFVAA